ncbi:autotransporter domain-containing protein [Desulfovibrio sp. OttesenSCG-928-I05]|nr:autotransporter domain-containing protein [Desulfovibrio sp. OttesenSCG-928-I05]
MSTAQERKQQYRGKKFFNCMAWCLAATLCLPPAASAYMLINGPSTGGIDVHTFGTDNAGNGEARITNNAVVTGDVYAGQAAGTGNANNNTVTLESGTVVSSSIIGGYAAGGSAFGNTVTLESGSTAHAFGGTTNSSSGHAYNNTVNLYQSAQVTGSLRGGSLRTGAPAANSYGNVLNIYGGERSSVINNVSHFQTINFYLAGTVDASSGAILKANNLYLNGAIVNVGVQGDSTALNIGDTVTLAQANTRFEGVTGNSTSKGMKGITQKLLFGITTDTTAKKVIATLLGTYQDGQVDAQLKSLAESRVSGVGMLTQGADMLTTQGIPQLRLNATSTSGPAAFGVMGGQSLRYNSGSHVDVDGVNLATGLGWNFPMNDGAGANLLLGAFFESGWGSYDSHNSFGNVASVKGDGDTSYYGGGLLARYDSAPAGPGSIYLETSFRAGKVESDYDSSGFETASGNEVNFDSSAAYYGAHAGIGYIWNISEASSLDLYTKYLWTRQGSDSVTIEGDSVRFKATDSHRWRSGAKFSHALATDSGLVFTPYIGAAYEHEFDSKARASANGNAIDAPDVKGGTGIGELGFTFKPSTTSGFSADLGVQGYTGKREGVGGSFRLMFEF